MQAFQTLITSSTDSDALVEFDLAARAVLRGGAVSESQRMSSKLVPAPLQRQISGQIAAAAVYANQASALIAEEARPLGPIFPRVADMNSTDSLEDGELETAGLGDAKLETELVEGITPLSFLSSSQKRAKKRKSGQGVRQV